MVLSTRTLRKESKSSNPAVAANARALAAKQGVSLNGGSSSSSVRSSKSSSNNFIRVDKQIPLTSQTLGGTSRQIPQPPPIQSNRFVSSVKSGFSNIGTFLTNLDKRIGIIPFAGTSTFSLFDEKVFAGFLPGGADRNAVAAQNIVAKIPGVISRAEAEKQLGIANLNLDKVRGNIKLLEQQQKDILDAQTFSIFEFLNPAERALNKARQGIAQQIEAGRINQLISDEELNLPDLKLPGSGGGSTFGNIFSEAKPFIIAGLALVGLSIATKFKKN